MERQAEARQRWLKERRTGIGGSDVAAVLGLSPWRSPMEVWLDKQGQVPDQPPTEQQWWGNALEDVIAQRYARETGRVVLDPERLYRHPQHDMLLATPDRLSLNPTDGMAPQFGLEVKTAGAHASREWGEPGTDQVPHHYLLQCAHYMAVTNLDRWDVAVLIGGSDFRIYTLRRDRELEAHVIERLVAWWRTHMQDGVQPDIDGSAGVRDWLARRYPRETEAEPLVADEGTEVLATRLAHARVAEEAAAAEREAMENSLKLVMGEHARLQGRGWGVSWKATKPRRTVDWQKVAAVLALDRDPEHVGQVIESHTTEAPAVRRFVFTITTDRRELQP